MKHFIFITIIIATISCLALVSRQDIARQEMHECIVTHAGEDNYPGTLREAYETYAKVCAKN